MQKGDEIHGYILDERIPGGGMAEVWKARHVGDDRTFCAIKFLKPEFLADSELRARFTPSRNRRRW